MMMRVLSRLAVTAFLCVGTVFAAESVQPQGTWKLRSQQVISGTAPSFPPGIVMTLDGAGRVSRFDQPVPASVIGRDRMRSTVSRDGRVLTQDAKGIDEKSGKPYRYKLTWDKR